MRIGKRPIDPAGVRHEMPLTAEKLLKRIDKSVEDGLMTSETAGRLRKAIENSDHRDWMHRKRGGRPV